MSIPKIFNVQGEGKVVYNDATNQFVVKPRVVGIGPAEREENKRAWKVFSQKILELYTNVNPMAYGNFYENETDLTVEKFQWIVTVVAQKHDRAIPIVQARDERGNARNVG